ncbi:MAG: hypothetical protein JXA89_01175 [Anaerolineae bacterium]|nr:hypothetical protein [Anaerolineae bacterium]
MRAAELIGLIMVAYGIWFGARGVRMYLSSDKSWWRHPSRKERYPYPAAGFLLSFVFILSGLVFLLYYTWANARMLGYAAGVVFIFVLVIGVAQPSVFHPRWYSQLEKRLGKNGMTKLRAAAYAVPTEEWREIVASDETFNAWVTEAVPAQPRHQSRAYKKT